MMSKTQQTLKIGIDYETCIDIPDVDDPEQPEIDVSYYMEQINSLKDDVKALEEQSNKSNKTIDSLVKFSCQISGSTKYTIQEAVYNDLDDVLEYIISKYVDNDGDETTPSPKAADDWEYWINIAGDCFKCNNYNIGLRILRHFDADQINSYVNDANDYVSFLHMAAFADDPHVVYELLKLGAEPTRLNHYNRSFIVVIMCRPDGIEMFEHINRLIDEINNDENINFHLGTIDLLTQTGGSMIIDPLIANTIYCTRTIENVKYLLKYYKEHYGIEPADNVDKYGYSVIDVCREEHPDWVDILFTQDEIRKLDDDKAKGLRK